MLPPPVTSPADFIESPRGFEAVDLRPCVAPPADDRAELVRLACMEFAATLGIKWAARLLATLPTTPAEERGALWADVARGVAKTSRGIGESHHFEALIRAADRMTDGAVDGGASALAWLEDEDLTVEGWYARQRAELATG